jgi:two-component system sensor histidine kinase YesM
MKYKFSIRSIRTKTVLIVLASMSVMLIFHGISIFSLISITGRNRREYISSAAESIAASLFAMGDNIRNMAMYIASFDSFKTLYFPDRNNAVGGTNETIDMIVSSFHSIRFIANYYPIIRDVVVVGLNNIPFSYYLGTGYEFMDLMEGKYDFSDPNAVESRFFYFDGEDFFIYATPISGSYSSAANTQKIATCIFICNLDYIRDIMKTHIRGGDIIFSVYDDEGRFIVSTSAEPDRPGEGGDVAESAGPYGQPPLLDAVIDAIPVDPPGQTAGQTVGLKIVASRRKPAGISGVLEDLFPGPNETLRLTWMFFMFSIFLLFIITATVIVLLHKQISRPISDLVNKMVAPDDKPLHIRLPRSGIVEIDHIAEGLNNLIAEIEEYTEKSLRSREKLYRMELAKNEAEMYALQSQINPHFLNNTLQCIRSIAISHGVEEIAAITLSMSELFRYSMNYQKQVRIRDEIEIVRHYVVITNLRFQNRFCFHFDIAPEILNASMCRMILQPLVENAVRHGVSRREEGGAVEIRGSRNGNTICLEVSDDGPGFGEWRLTEIQHQLAYSFEKKREIKKESSFGLYNIDRRIKLQYGPPYGLEIGRERDRTQVRIRFPDLPVESGGREKNSGV